MSKIKSFLCKLKNWLHKGKEETMKELAWLSRGYELLGLQEDTSKTRHNPKILQMLSEMGSFSGESRAWWANDEEPWCGLFVGNVLGHSGRYVVKEWYRAKAWKSLISKLDKPYYGCIAVFGRDGGGHVGFVVGKDKQGNLMVLGGNQANKVSVAPFPISRLEGCYWPLRKDFSSFSMKDVLTDLKAVGKIDLPLIEHTSRLSENEA